MWSFIYLEANDADRLASKLEFLDLPQDWFPRFCKAYDYGPSVLPEDLTWERYNQFRGLQEQLVVGVA